MADQMTARLTSAYGHPAIRTPNLERLCREGVRFDAAYSNCPLCAPARAAMLCGRYTSRTRTYDNGSILPSDIPTFAHSLRLAGYEVVADGKLHLVGADQLHGFERRLTTDIYPSDFSWASTWADIAAREGKPLTGKWEQIPEAGWCESSMQLDYDREVHFRALEFLRQRSTTDRRQPYCLLVSYTHPHPPYLAPRAYWDMYENVPLELPRIPQNLDAHRCDMDRWLHLYEGIPDDVLRDQNTMRRLHRAYAGMITYVDELLGELLQTLDTFGLRRNTAVLFTSDHGDMLGERGLIEKRVFYEWSAQVPLIASFPAAWQSNAVCPEPVSLVDLCPTLADFTGGPAPEGVDGRSLLGLLRGQQEPGRVAISENHGEGVMAPCFMVRKGPHKYVHVHNGDDRLFDVHADPGEWTDLAGNASMAPVIESLRGELLSRLDPAAIAADALRSQADRQFLRDAMHAGRRTPWDYQPVFDAATAYCRP